MTMEIYPNNYSTRVFIGCESENAQLVNN
jgi:hypothetical protein